MKQTVTFLLDRGIGHKEQYITAPHTSFRIGGVADLAIFPRKREELIETIAFLRAQKMPFEVIGNASNVLFAFDRFEGALVFTEHMDRVEQRDHELICDCGVSLTALSAHAAELGLSGLEFAYGIPGTVGGAVFMNAGAYGSCVSEVLTKSLAYDCVSGRATALHEHEFGYRSSLYMKQPSLICLEATFSLTPDDREQIRARMRTNMESRREKQPLSFPSAGSYFKRPEGHFAGKLIEDAGLKGARVGGAQISEKHAGFLINCGGATASDVLALEEMVRQTVWERFGVRLEREVRVIR